MAFKNITSSDARKPEVSAALKSISGATAVTMLKEDTARGVAIGHCLTKGIEGQSFGFWAVDLSTLQRAAGPCVSQSSARIDAGFADELQKSEADALSEYDRISALPWQERDKYI